MLSSKDNEQRERERRGASGSVGITHSSKRRLPGSIPLTFESEMYGGSIPLTIPGAVKALNCTNHEDSRLSSCRKKKSPQQVDHRKDDESIIIIVTVS
jgi:hypothetical protein